MPAVTLFKVCVLSMIFASECLATINAFTAWFDIVPSGPIAAQVESVQCGDIDGDGDQDLVVWDLLSNRVMVLRSTGGQIPGFELEDLGAPGGAIAPLADMDGDGRIDFVVAAAGAVREAHFFRQVDGPGPRFERTVIFSSPAAGAAFQFVAGGDVEGDGDYDIVIGATERTFFGRSLLSDGGGLTWSFTSFNDLVRNPRLVDVDGDGDLDIGCVRWTAPRVAWFERAPGFEGGSSFSRRTVEPGDANNKAFAAADIDGDGDNDFVSASSDTRTIRMHVNLGGSPPTWASSVFAEEMPGVSDLCFTDVGADGDMDLIAASTDDDAVRLFENIGGGPAGFREEIITHGADRPRTLAAVDIDADGDEDLVVSSTLDDALRCHVNTAGDPDRTRFRPRALDVPFYGARHAVAADFSGDGHCDVAAISYSPSVVRWHRSVGGDPMAFTPTTLVSSGSLYTHLSRADFDVDGAPDLLVASFFGTRVRCYHNSGGPEAALSGVVVSNRDCAAAAAGDLDGDGDQDVVLPGNGVFWVENKGGSPPFFEGERAIHDPGGGYVGYSLALVVDLDGDGDQDVLGAASQTLRIFENSGGGEFPPHLWRDLDVTPYALAACDIDDDGDEDLIVGDGDGVIVFTNDGLAPASFAATRIHRAKGRNVVSLHAADIDADGDRDVLVGVRQGGDGLLWLENRGANAPPLVHIIQPGLGRCGGEVADIDGDGDLDVVAAMEQHHEVVWFENLRPRRDLTGDGLVNAQDIAFMLGSWGLCAEDATCRADLDGDRLVNSRDLAQLLGAWGARE